MYSQQQEETRANRAVTRYMQGELDSTLNFQKVRSRWSCDCIPNGEELTNLSASRQVEVDEIAAALSCGQVLKTFISEFVAVSQTEVLKVDTVPVKDQLE